MAVMATLLLFLAIGAATSSAMGFARDRAWARVQAEFLAGLRQEMFDHVQVLSIGFFQSDRGGGVLSNFSNDISTVENAAAMAIPWGLLPSLECVFSSILSLPWIESSGLRLCCYGHCDNLGPALFYRSGKHRHCDPARGRGGPARQRCRRI